MSRSIVGMCIGVAALTVTLQGQDRKMIDMGKSQKMDDMAKEHRYAGCVENASAAGYALTHVTSAEAMNPNR
jgi:hypothetical protein